MVAVGGCSFLNRGLDKLVSSTRGAGVPALNRRAFVCKMAAGAIAGLPTRRRVQDDLAQYVKIQVQPETRLARIPVDFMGLGYEVSSVSEGGLLSGSNQAYVRFVRTLGTAGVIRIGGNTSDYASWSAHGPAVASPKGTVIDRRSLCALATFLQATGWRLVWGLNLGRGSLDEIVEEAVAVATTVGDNLLAFEIGNEPDLFRGIHRPDNFAYADYYAEYSRFKNAIRDKLPKAPFAGPDVIVQTDWLEQFAKTEADDLKLLTHHYYAEGPPESPASTIENLLRPNEILPELLGRLKTASQSAAIPYRICEANSCFGGGKLGVSDTMAASLWGLDFLFQMAEFNAAGVNLETGVNHLGFLSWYTPIGIDSAQLYRAEPLYYGLLAFAVAGRGHRLRVMTDTGGLNMTAYAVISDDNTIWLTLINKDATREAHVRAACTGIAAANALRLTAASLTSKDGVLLGGSAVSSAGVWRSGPPETVPVTRGELEVVVHPGSAALLQLGLP